MIAAFGVRAIAVALDCRGLSMAIQRFQGPEHAGLGFDEAAICTLTYQSKVATRPDSKTLHALLRHAKARNRSADVTGMLLFNDDRFFQWLEGPKEGLSEIWTSIQNDPRHQEIELLSYSQAQQRMFSHWDMRFVCPDDAFGAVRDPAAPQPRLPIALIDAAAQLAIDQDASALQDGIEDVVHMGFDMAAIYSELIEPVAHRLGDLWLDDVCNDAAIGVALSCLQTAVRRVSAPHGAPKAMSRSPRHILVMPPPGEAHMLGVALVGDLYRDAGWLVDVAFPRCDEEVAALVKNQWFDALTFCLSDVFTRFHRISALAMTIRQARRSSVNPALQILVGGRTFGERPDLAELLGVDGSYADLACAVENTRACLRRAGAAHAIN